jgi:hypothetical protein
MKRTTKQSVPPRFTTPPRPPQRGWSNKRHLTVLVALLAAWLILFLLVLLEHAREWTRLLPVLFVVLIVYGAVVTRKIITESKHQRD